LIPPYPYFDEKLGKNFMAYRDRAMSILQEEASLQEIVKLVGQDSLSAPDRITLETARMIREDFLQQNAFVDLDSYTSYEKQERLLGLILKYSDMCSDAVERGCEDVLALFGIEARERIGRAKMVPQDEFNQAFNRSKLI
jgi:V/A-type H+-transporting ATPase subunit A